MVNVYPLKKCIDLQPRGVVQDYGNCPGESEYSADICQEFTS